MDKVLLITGASSDMGCGLIRKCEKNYSTILAQYRTESAALNELKGILGEKLVLLQADFMIQEDVKRLIDEIDSRGLVPDHIVHFSAPKAFNQKFQKCGWEKYEESICVSLRSIVVLLQHFLPMQAKKRYGKTVFVLSSYVLNKPPKFQSVYVTIKYALLGLMKSLAVEYAEKGICINSISPDMTETKFLSDIPDLIVRQNAENSPIGRNLTVDDVIPSIEFLLSEGADTITGQNIGITGGMQ